MRLPIVITISLSLLACSSPAQPDRAELRRNIEALGDGDSFTSNGMTFTMHRKSAGDPLPSGWFKATSTGCGFTVLLPGPFNDFSQSGPTSDGTTLTSDTVGMQTLEGAKFTALCLRRADGNLPQDWSRFALDGLAKSLQPSRSEEVVFSGLTGYELRGASASGSLVVVRTLGGSQVAYQFIVEYPASEDDYMPQLADTFLESFEPAPNSD